MHMIALALGRTVSELQRSMSACEFMQWLTFLDLERCGPAWERARHADVLAAHANGPLQLPGGRSGAWSLADFLPADPWQAKPKTAESADDLARRLQLEVAAIEDAFVPAR